MKEIPALFDNYTMLELLNNNIPMISQHDTTLSPIYV